MRHAGHRMLWDCVGVFVDVEQGSLKNILVNKKFIELFFFLDFL